MMNDIPPIGAERLARRMARGAQFLGSEGAILCGALAGGSRPNPIGAERLARRMARGVEFLGSEVAILCGAMSWVSERNLVAAISNAGGFGLIACGEMSADLLVAEIKGDKVVEE